MDRSLNLAAVIIDVASAYVLVHRIIVRVRAMRALRTSPTNLRLVS